MKKPVTKKVSKKREFETVSFDCDDATLARLNKIADLAAVTLSQTVSVMLATYLVCDGEGC